MNQKEVLEKIAEINPAFIKQVEALLECKARFCRIVMKPNPEEDAKKRDGKQRTYNVNVRATYERMAKKHIDPNYRFDGNPSIIKARRTCTERAILGVVENAMVDGVQVQQFRNVDLKKIESISCGEVQETF